MIRPPPACTALVTSVSASARSRVLNRVMPGDERPSSLMHELPWMISPTPARAFSPKASA
jgi:hypothetical protein